MQRRSAAGARARAATAAQSAPASSCYAPTSTTAPRQRPLGNHPPLRSDAERRSACPEVFRQDPYQPARVQVDDYRGGEEFVFNRVFPPAASNGEVSASWDYSFILGIIA